MARIKTQEVKELTGKGMSVAQIAKKYNVTREAIYRHVRKIKGEKEEPKHSKKEYKYTINWRTYNENLVKRGELLLDFEIFNNWDEELSLINQDKIGAPYKYPFSFIHFCAQIKALFGIDYRSLEGLARKIIEFAKKDKAPDYTTFNIRFGNLPSELEVYGEQGEQELAIDSSGLKTQMRGEYRISKYRGKRKKFIKLSIAVNTKTKQVVGFSVTFEEGRDNKELPKLKEEAEKYGRIKKAWMDAGYDDKKAYWLFHREKADAIIKPRKTADLERVKELIKERRDKLKNEASWRKREEILATLLRLNNLKEYLENEEGWRGKRDYGQRWIVESRYSVFKRKFNEHVFSRKIRNIYKEVAIKLSLMNFFTYAIKGDIQRVEETT